VNARRRPMTGSAIAVGTLIAERPPQGGFVTRKPTVDVVASRSVQGDGFFGFFFQPNPQPQPANVRQRGGKPHPQGQQGFW
jgi:hypothetical protein